MLLMEFMYYDDNSSDMKKDHRYDNKKDSSVLRKRDSRKLRLTLRQINQLRKQSEAHEFEVESEREFITKMYQRPAESQE